MALNEILKFAVNDTGSNLLSQNDYDADIRRQNGHQPGLASQLLFNKIQRQTTTMASGLAQYIANKQAQDITDALTPTQVADYLEAAIAQQITDSGLTNVTTPPQFDNSTAIATTEFVKRTGVEYSNIVVAVGTATLTASNAGALIIARMNSGNTITLPLASAMPAGTTITVIASRDNQIVQRQGSDLLYMAAVNAAGTDDITSLVLNTGDTVTFLSGGGTSGAWYAIDGTGQLKYATHFKAVLGDNGYQILPSGLYLQWGRASYGDIGGAGQNIVVSVTFPVAFPNTVFNIQGTVATTTSTANVNIAVRASSLNTTGVQFNVTEYLTATQSDILVWFAVGY